MATIVGALLVLLSLLVVLSVLFAAVVPSWMSGEERALANSAGGSFAALQSAIELQLEPGGPGFGSTPFTLSSGSIPVLASPTQGTLVFEPGGTALFANVTFSGGASGTLFSRNASLGRLALQLPNRYSPSEVLAFEDDAVLQSVAGAPSRVVQSPLFAIDQHGENRSVSIVVLSLTGTATSIASPGSTTVIDRILSGQPSAIRGPVAANGSRSPFAMTIQLGSSLACAWAQFFAGSLASSGIPPSEFQVAGPSGCVGGNPSGVTDVTLSGVTFASVWVVDVSLSLGGGTA